MRKTLEQIEDELTDCKLQMEILKSQIHCAILDYEQHQLEYSKEDLINVIKSIQEAL